MINILILGAIHAHYAIVFARLIHEGVDEGLHGYINCFFFVSYQYKF